MIGSGFRSGFLGDKEIYLFRLLVVNFLDKKQQTHYSLFQREEMEDNWGNYNGHLDLCICTSYKHPELFSDLEVLYHSVKRHENDLAIDPQLRFSIQKYMNPQDFKDKENDLPISSEDLPF